VADFGIGGLAARRALEQQASRASVISRTLPSAVQGAFTPLYASPQQIRGEKPDPRDDVHALGVIWYQLLTGDLGLLAIPPDWRDVVEEVGLEANGIEVLASCLSSRAERRPAEAGVLAERLAGLSTSPVTPPSRKEQTLKVLRRHGFLSEGTDIELMPDAVSGDAPRGDPKLFRAQIGNIDSKKSVIWAKDGNAYSLTELSCKLEDYGLLWVRPKTFELWRIAGQKVSM
jgi:hypothetical protein